MKGSPKLLLGQARNLIQAAKSLAEVGLYELSINWTDSAMVSLVKALLWNKQLTFPKNQSPLPLFKKHFITTGAMEPKFYLLLIESNNLRTQENQSHPSESLRTHPQAEEQIAHAEEFLTMTETLLNT